MNQRVGILIVILFGALSATIHCVQGFVGLTADAKRETCALVKKDCISSGGIFKRNVVCASNGKRFINECSLQLRSCDLYLDTGELLTEKRCLWIYKDDIDKDKIEEEDSGDLEEPKDSGTSEEKEESKEEGESDEEEEGGGTSEEEEDTSEEEEDTSEEDTSEEEEDTSEEEEDTSEEEEDTSEEEEDAEESDGFSYSALYDTFTPLPPGDIQQGGQGCSCRGDSSCPSCFPISEDLGGPVCGTDGNTYKTECAMDTERCSKGQLDLIVDHDGSCSSKDGDVDDHVSTSSDLDETPARGDLG